MKKIFTLLPLLFLCFLVFGQVGYTGNQKPDNAIPSENLQLKFAVLPVCLNCAIPENEPDLLDNQLDIVNGGCNSTPNVFSLLGLGDVICGRGNQYLFGSNDYRDTDWYKFLLSEGKTLYWSVIADFPVAIYILNAGCPAGMTIVGNDNVTPGSATTISAALPPGEYVFFVAPAGWDPTYEGNYMVTLTDAPPVEPWCGLPPVIACPADITVDNSTGQCGAVVNYLLPEITDDGCDLPTTLPNCEFIIEYGGHHYFILQQSKNWPDSKTIAESLGGYLAIFETAAENTAVNDVLKARYPGGTYWIGGYQDAGALETYGGWKWINGTPVSYMNWREIEPNNADGYEQALMVYCTDGMWNDASESSARWPVFEFSCLEPELINGLASGSLFPVGTTTVTYQAEDESGNTSECSFTVEVVDAENPHFGEVGPIKADYFDFIHFSHYKYSEYVTAIDFNWYGLSPNVSLLGGDYFSIRYTSSFTAPVTGAYNFRAVTDDGFRLYLGDDLIMNHWVTQDDPSYNVNVNLTAGQTLPLKMEFFEYGGEADIHLYYTVPGGIEQIFEYKTKVIADQARSMDADKCNYTAKNGEFDPVFGDNCSATLVNDFNGQASLNGAEFPAGETEVEWTATDPAGNATSFTFTVTVTDDQMPVAACKNMEVFLSEEGSVTIDPSDVDNGSSDNCDFDITFKGSEAGCAEIGAGVHYINYSELWQPFASTFGQSKYQVLYTAAELTAAGLTAGSPITSIAFNLAEKNTTLPIPGFEISVALLAATTIGDAANTFATATFTLVRSAAPYSTLLGWNSFTLPTPLVWDGTSGLLIQTCHTGGSNVVTHTDGVYTYPATGNQVVSGYMQNCSATTGLYTHKEVPQLKICAGAGGFTQNSITFTCDNVGTNEVTLLITDASGQTDECTATVTVTDDILPTIDCPDDITVDTDAGKCYATIASLGVPTVDDNCGIKNGTLKNDAPTNLQFPFGENTVIWTVEDVNGNTNTCAQTITVEYVTTVTAVTVDPVSQQYSDLVKFTATITPYECNGAGVVAETVTFFVGIEAVGTADLVNGVAEGTFPLLETDDTDFGTGALSPGLKTVTAVFNDPDEDFIVVNPTTSLTVTCENALVEYTGGTYFTTNPAGAGSIYPEAYVVDAVDGNPGDIRNATVTFKSGDTSGPALGDPNIPVGLIDPDVTTEGYASGEANFQLTAGQMSGGGMEWTVWTTVNSYYCGVSADAEVITLAMPGPDYVTGGGFTILTDAASGQYPGAEGTKMNFGFVMKWNKSGKSLQGRVNIIYRGPDGFNYQIKSNAINSLVISANADYKMAVITTKANLKRIYPDGTFDDLGGNLTLTMNAWESTEEQTGKLDMISVQLAGAKGAGIYFSSNIERGKTIVQLLDGGKIQVRDEMVEAAEAPKSAHIGLNYQVTEMGLKVYPNPFTDRVVFEFSPAVTGKARIDILDLNGRLIRTIFDQTVDAGNNCQATFEPGTAVDGLYLYRATIGNDVRFGKLIRH